MWRLFIAMALIVCTADASPAFDISGIQPLAPHGVFSVFSAESLDAGGISAEISSERSREPDYYRFTGRAAYGLRDNMELLVTAPYVYDYQGDGDGVEDISLGFKHRVHDEGRFGPSVAYLLTVSLPVGKESFSSDGRIGGGIIVSKRVGPFFGHFNAFIAKPGRSDLTAEISFGTGLVFHATHNSWLLGEAVARRGPFSSTYDQVEVRAGLRLRTTDTILTTVGAGVDLKNRNPEYRLLLTVSFVPSSKKQKVQKIYEEE